MRGGNTMSLNRVMAFLAAFVATFASTTVQSEAQPTGGSFSCVLTFLNQGPNRIHVSSLPTGEDVTFDVSVTDSTGSPATSGVVKIAACRLQAEFAPADDCVSGAGHWRTLHFGRGIEVFPEGFGDLVGHVLAFGGTSDIPATRGYRGQYFQDGGRVEAVCEADFTWF